MNERMVYIVVYDSRPYNTLYIFNVIFIQKVKESEWQAEINKVYDKYSTIFSSVPAHIISYFAPVEDIFDEYK